MQLAWKELSREVVFDGKYGRAMEKVRYEMPDGRQEDFYIMRQTNGAAVLALTPERDVVLVRQFRPGKNAVMLELPGGGVKADQSPEEAARAELLEETGYAGDLQFIGTSSPDGYSTRMTSVFVATNCVKVAEPTLDANEFIEVVRLPLAEFRQYIRTGAMTDGEGAYLALDYLGLL